MLAVAVEIRRYVDDSFPRVVECRLVDVGGREHLFVEKVPVVTAADLDGRSEYPQPGVIACKIVERRNGTVVIDTARPWLIASMAGETQFEVRPEQLTEFDRCEAEGGE